MTDEQSAPWLNAESHLAHATDCLSQAESWLDGTDLCSEVSDALALVADLHRRVRAQEQEVRDAEAG